MKRANIFLSTIAIISFFVMSCNSDDYKKEPDATTETVTLSQPAVSDTGSMMTTDTSGKASMPKTTATGKKGKVSSIMATSNAKKNAPMNQDKQGYYSNVEILPTYPGGQNALDNFVFKNLEYPQDAVDNNIEGIVTVNFAVDETGKVSNAKTLGKTLGYGLEEAVLNAVAKMPTWTPGVIKGKNVKTYYTLPVNFKLEQ